MTQARKHLVCLEDTPYYHVVSRCVRRAFLCGFDQLTGQSYEHRRGWIENRVRVLSSLFSVHICAYAVMSNHYHLVVKLDPEASAAWSDDDVLDRWTSLFHGPLLVQRYRAGGAMNPIEQETLKSLATIYRSRLASLSWFMKCLNEPIARQANAEDGCRGHFWEARFHSQALCSDRALLAAMAYVDLNPVRAGIADKPETSVFTSLRARMRPKTTEKRLSKAIGGMLKRRELQHFETAVRPLMAFADPGSGVTLPIRKTDYLQLVDVSGRAIAYGKHGRIDSALEPILERLGLSVGDWVRSSTTFRKALRRGELRLQRIA